MEIIVNIDKKDIQGLEKCLEVFGLQGPQQAAQVIISQCDIAIIVILK